MAAPRSSSRRSRATSGTSGFCWSTADAKILSADGSSVLLGVFNETIMFDTRYRTNEVKDKACREVIEELLDAGAPLDTVDARGRNAIHLAAEHRLDETLKMLLARRGDSLDLEAQDYEGRTALHVAAQMRNKKIVDLLLEAQASVTSRTHERKTVMHSLLDDSFEGSDQKEEVNEIFDALAAAGAPLTALDRRNQSLLHLAGEHDMKDIFQKLLPEFEDYAGQTTWGTTALQTLLCSMDAHDGGDEEDIELCSTAAVDGDDDEEDVDERKKKKNEETRAADEKQKFEPKSWPELLKDMFERDDRAVFTRDDEGRLPIHMAAKFKHGKTLAMLLENYHQNEAAKTTSEPSTLKLIVC
ncbi:unnamed protein product [Trichogramma brassicae]|uniref:Uncharacterized protein n=1 Tax=Trichogramma brassicae TaxID=86971 RepID=A0A6H5I4I8_9HYME|nr:unnamed protein product [Trichogramma brassicae]